MAPACQCGGGAGGTSFEITWKVGRRCAVFLPHQERPWRLVKRLCFSSRKLAEDFRVRMQTSSGTVGFENAFYLRALVRFVAGNVWLDKRRQCQCRAKRLADGLAGRRSCSRRYDRAPGERCVRGRCGNRRTCAPPKGWGSIIYWWRSACGCFLGPPNRALGGQVPGGLARLV